MLSVPFGWLSSFVPDNKGSWYKPSLEGDHDPDHVIVLQHGLHGFPGVFDYLIEQLTAKMPNEKLWFILPNQSRRFMQTHEDIRVGGQNIAETIKSEVQAIVDRFGRRKRRFSILGHSLGGIYVRACIGVLEEQKWFTTNEDLIDPAVFFTVASPHLGTRPLLNMAGMQGTTPMALIAALGGRVMSVAQPVCYVVLGFLRNGLGTAGQQLVLEDPDKLLVQMADKESLYIRGLKRFKRHCLFVNIANDMQVPFYTSSITMGVPDGLEKQGFEEPQESDGNISQRSQSQVSEAPEEILMDQLPVSKAPKRPVLKPNNGTDDDEWDRKHCVLRSTWTCSETDAWKAAMAYEDGFGDSVKKMCVNLNEAVSWHRRFVHLNSSLAHDRILFETITSDAIVTFLAAEEFDILHEQDRDQSAQN